MNTYIRAQINNVLIVVRTFEDYCAAATLKDNDKVDKEEKRTLKKIRSISRKFTRDMNRLLEQENLDI